MARKKKPALGSRDFDLGAEPDDSKAVSEPLIIPPPEPKPKPTVIKAPPKPAKPSSEGPGVRLEVFLRASGKKLDQMAGFRRYAINHGLSQMTIKDWRREFEKFLSLPV